MQQYGITVKESRGQLSYLPSGRTKFIRAKHLGDNYDKEAVLATLTANAEHKPKAQFKQETKRGTAQTENRKAEGCVLFPGGRTDAAGEIKECAYDQPENRP